MAKLKYALDFSLCECLLFLVGASLSVTERCMLSPIERGYVDAIISAASIISLLVFDPFR